MRYLVALLPALFNITLGFAKPTEVIWNSEQGNAAHTGYISIKTDPAKFHVLWTKDIIENAAELKDHLYKAISIVTTDKMAYFDIGNEYGIKDGKLLGSQLLIAIDPATGNAVWQSSTKPFFYSSNLAFDNDHIIAYRYINDSEKVFQFFQPDTGTLDYSVPSFINHEIIYNGLLADNGKLFPIQGNVLSSIDARTGKEEWSTPIKYKSYSMPAANSQYVVTVDESEDGCGISVYDRQNKGYRLYDVVRTKFYRTMPAVPMPMLDNTNQIAYVVFRESSQQYGYPHDLIAYDLKNENIKWIARGYNGIPALANNEIFIPSNQWGNAELKVLDATTAAEKWSWRPDSEPGVSQLDAILVTNDVVFISSYKKTYAISRKTHQKVWEYDDKGQMALGKEVLYIVKQVIEADKSYKVRVTAIGLK